MDRPDGWVYVVAVRVAMRRRPTAGSPDRENERAGHRRSRTYDPRDVANRRSDRLPERQRLAIVLRYLADLPVVDVAAAMGCAAGTVKSTLHAALARLQVGLDETEEVEHDAT